MALPLLDNVSYVRDFERLLRAKQIVAGMDFNVRIPPPAVVPNAVKLVPEIGSAVAVHIERVTEAVLYSIIMSSVGFTGVRSLVALLQADSLAQAIASAKRYFDKRFEKEVPKVPEAPEPQNLPGTPPEGEKQAMADLSPWPDDPREAATAFAELEKHLDFANLPDDPRHLAQLHGPAGAALVERYAPNAPQPIKNLAVVRVCQYLAARPGDMAVSVRESLGDAAYERQWSPTMTSALRGSGAMALLTGWQERRLGTV